MAAASWQQGFRNYFISLKIYLKVTTLTLNKGRNQSRRHCDILEMDSKTDAKSESHKIVNALNKQSLRKTVLGFASASRYKCRLLLQTLLCKLSTQQHGLPLKRQKPQNFRNM